MKKAILILSAINILFSACSTTSESQCPDLICTQEFRMVQVEFKDATGNNIAVNDFTAINKRTGESTIQNNEPSTVNTPGSYIVASDADLKELSESGDAIVVSATNPETNKKSSAEIVVSGGKCACHITKLSGPSEIIL